MVLALSLLETSGRRRPAPVYSFVAADGVYSKDPYTIEPAVVGCGYAGLGPGRLIRNDDGLW